MLILEADRESYASAAALKLHTSNKRRMGHSIQLQYTLSTAQHPHVPHCPNHERVMPLRDGGTDAFPYRGSGWEGADGGGFCGTIDICCPVIC